MGNSCEIQSFSCSIVLVRSPQVYFCLARKCKRSGIKQRCRFAVIVTVWASIFVFNFHKTTYNHIFSLFSNGRRCSTQTVRGNAQPVHEDGEQWQSGHAAEDSRRASVHARPITWLVYVKSNMKRELNVYYSTIASFRSNLKLKHSTALIERFKTHRL